MKLKILLTPILIIAIAIFIIWGIFPNVMTVLSERSGQEDIQKKVADMQSKSVMAGKLAQELTVSADQKNMLDEYLPDSKKEEEIVNNLNSIANNAGVSIYNLSLDQAENGKTNVPAVSEMQNSDLSASQNQSGKPVDYNVDYGIIGSYDKIKAVIDKLSHLRRFNSIDSLKIAEASASSGQPSDSAQGNASAAPQDYLQADISLSFDYLPDSGVANLSNSIFSSGNFDMSIVDNIKNNTDANAAQVTAGTAGKANPFLP